MAVTWDPATASAGIVLSGGNLVASNPASGATDEYVFSTVTGTKVYFEIVATADASPGTNDIGVGAIDGSFAGFGDFMGHDVAGHSVSYYDGNPVYYASTIAFTLVNYTTADNIGVAIDAPNKKVWYRKTGGNWNNDVIANQNPATGAGGIALASMSSPIKAAVDLRANQGSTVTAKFDSSSWTYTAPAGFSALLLPTTVVFRRSLSALGTRTGSRQSVGS